MDEPCRRKMLSKLLDKAAVSPADMDHLVGTTDDYTPAQLEELANTLYILAVGGDNAHVRATGTPTGQVSVQRPLIDTALAEMQIERKPRLGFHAA